MGGTKAEEVRDLRGRGDLPRFPSISLGQFYFLSLRFLLLECRVLLKLASSDHDQTSSFLGLGLFDKVQIEVLR